MFSFAILLFFAFTGITLNHLEWFTDQQRTITVSGEIPKNLLSADTNQLKRIEIVEFFRSKYHITSPLKDFMIDEYQCVLSFKGPGYANDIFLERETGKYDLTEINTGLIGKLNDLHKGRDTSFKWRWLIDISAILLILISITGFLMLLFLKKKRITGLLIVLLGTILAYVIYLL